MILQREVSIAFQSNKTPLEYTTLARQAESYGFDMVSVYGDLMFQPPIGPLLLMAQTTTRIRLGAASYNPYTLHPVEIAGQVALLDAVSNGRAYWGIVRGAWLDSLGLMQPKPVTTVREAIGLVRHLLAKRHEPFAGEVFHLDAHSSLQYDVRRPEVPLLVGAWGPRLAAVAGELADEMKVGGSANPAVLPLMRERIATGTLRVRRRRDTVGLVVGAVTVVDEDGNAARRKAKAELALYLPTVAALDPTVSVDPELVARVQECVKRGASDEAAALLSDDLLYPFTFAGTPADIIAHAEALFAAGATRIEFGTPHGLSNMSGVRLLGEKVLPALRFVPRTTTATPLKAVPKGRSVPAGVASRTGGTYHLEAGPFTRFTDLGRFQTALTNLTGVRNAYIRQFIQGNLEMTCDHNGAVPLVDLLRTLPMVTQVEESGAYDFRITVAPLAPPPSVPPPPAIAEHAATAALSLSLSLDSPATDDNTPTSGAVTPR